MKKRFLVTIMVVAIGSLVLDLGVEVRTWGQPLTHTVKKGDTLWDICEEYYGNQNLWPKLWEMNPFVTNPHLLKPGDSIKLLEDVPVKKLPVVKKTAAPPVQRIDDSARLSSGIDVSGLTNVEAIGFLSTKKVAPLGHISMAETERVVLAEGDTVYVTITSGGHPKPGDQCTIYQHSPLLMHPTTGKKLGYVVSFLGRIVLKKHINDLIYKAEIVKSFRAVHKGDLLLSCETVPTCVQLTPSDRELSMQVVAVKDLREIIGQFSVVYFDYGYQNGIRRGNLLEVVKKMRVESPQEIQLPDLVLGHILILEASPDTATGVIVACTQELSRGVRVRSLDVVRARQVLSGMPGCSTE